jgi:hypothetical protein
VKTPLVPLLNLIASFSNHVPVVGALQVPTSVKFVIEGLAIGAKHNLIQLSASIPLFPFPNPNLPYQFVFVPDHPSVQSNCHLRFNRN